MLQQKINKKSTLTPIVKKFCSSDFMLSKIDCLMFCSPYRLIASNESVMQAPKQKVRAINTLFIMFLLLYSFSCFEIGNRLIINPYEVNVMLIQSTTLSKKFPSRSAGYIALSDFGIINRTTSNMMIPTNRILL